MNEGMQNHKQVIHGVLRLAQEDKSPSERAVQRDSPELHRLAIDCYGSWQNALAQAGVGTQTRSAIKYDGATQVLQSIRRLCYAGRCLQVRNVKRDHYTLYEAALAYFGSWRNALDAAGINRAQLGNPRKWDRDRIIEAILQRAVERRALGSSTVRPSSLKTAAQEEFGSWENALRAAGLVPREHIGRRRSQCRDEHKQQRWDRQRVLSAIRQRRVLGLPLDRNAVCRDNRALVNAARTYFGDWPSALQFAEVESI